VTARIGHVGRGDHHHRWRFRVELHGQISHVAQRSRRGLDERDGEHGTGSFAEAHLEVEQRSGAEKGQGNVGGWLRGAVAGDTAGCGAGLQLFGDEQ
jgi:hypothetical protein